MNYPTFLKHIDELIEKSDKEKLTAFIHEIAQLLSEDWRERFLSVLEECCAPSEAGSEMKCDGLPETIDRMLDKLDEINAGERELGSRYNPEWESWNDDEWNEEYFFSDPNGILNDLNRTVDLIHASIDREEYRKGYELALQLSELIVCVDGDYDGGMMNIEELIRYSLVDGTNEALLKECVYLAFMGSDDRRRAEAMLEIMDNLHGCISSLEEILEMSDGKTDVQSFLPSWIEALAVRNDWKIDDYLEEAVSMLADGALALDFASRYALTHPIIYSSILHHGLRVTDEEMTEIGLKAIDEVTGDTKVRKDICLYTARYALKCEKQETAENCWLEAFRTDSSVTNYLRLRLLAKDWVRYAETVKNINMTGNKPGSTTYSIIRFLDTDFDDLMYGIVRNDDGTNSSSSGSDCVPFFLLLLSSEVEGMGMEAMLKRAVSESSFRTSEYILGTGIEDKRPDAAVFSECFNKWKMDITLDEEVCTRWIKNIDIWLQHYVQVAMDNNDRSSYGLYAQYIAALGEVEEARGKTGFKQELMQAYRDMYWRRRSFVDELVKYGYRK